MFTCAVSVATVIALFGVVVESQAEDDCRDVSDDVDKWLSESGSDMRRSGADSAAVAGFKRDIQVSVYGFDIPFLGIHLEVKNGSLESLDTLARGSSVKKCRYSTTNVTSGDFRYENVSIHFSNMKAKFLFWQTEGTFTYKFLPTLRLVFESKSNSSCHLAAPVTLQSSGDSDYDMDTGSSVKGWIIGKLLRCALLGGGDNTPMLTDFLQLATQAIDSYFANYCCKGMQAAQINYSQTRG